ncbi:nuclear transport factor 2 family protein [Streptomyces sp. CRN 30]|uniref:nuclear transport factor 2 family protein n=1 Tax=Streptomyces sp. CRN 30 TaxID=3075613 RepID=UPI002A81F645|nr:nuclear transport factor 2 family protein [Streptomyces sp. CRN 30]
MTQRVELATVLDRLAVDGLITEYAVALDDGDWRAYRELFTPDARADYRSAGGIEGDVDQVADWLARSTGLLAVRQHLVVNRRVRFGVLEQDTGDTAHVQADYVSPLRFASPDGTPDPPHPAADTAPDLLCGGRYAFTLLRTEDGWRLREVVLHEKWRRTADGRPVPS